MKSGITRLYELREIFSKVSVLILDSLSKEQSRKQLHGFYRNLSVGQLNSIDLLISGQFIKKRQSTFGSAS
jgi:hypothetical protein